MGANTNIEWCDFTFNHVRGCTKVSEGCRNCYAETLSKRNPKTLGIWGQKGTRVVAAENGESGWAAPVKWNKEAGERFDRIGDSAFATPEMLAEASRRPRVFCASLADVFEDWTGPMMAAGKEPVILGKDFRASDGSNRLRMDDVRIRLFRLIHATPNLDWLLLTKRPENVSRMLSRYAVSIDSYIAEAFSKVWNRRVWLGTSVENQAAADERIPHLLRTPAAVRFLSCEPLLGPVDLREHIGYASYSGNIPGHCVDIDGGSLHAEKAKCRTCGWGYPNDPDNPRRVPGIDWVIVGGESGPGARPMHPAWARSIRDQCQAAGVPFFFKQWGRWAHYCNEEHFTHGGKEKHAHTWIDSRTGENGLCWITDDDDFTWSNWTGSPDLDEHGRITEHVAVMGDFGKKTAGRVLDGCEWSQFPEVRT